MFDRACRSRAAEAGRDGSAGGGRTGAVHDLSQTACQPPPAPAKSSRACQSRRGPTHPASRALHPCPALHTARLLSPTGAGISRREAQRGQRRGGGGVGGQRARREVQSAGMFGGHELGEVLEVWRLQDMDLQAVRVDSEVRVGDEEPGKPSWRWWWWPGPRGCRPATPPTPGWPGPSHGPLAMSGRGSCERRVDLQIPMMPHARTSTPTSFT